MNLKRLKRPLITAKNLTKIYGKKQQQARKFLALGKSRKEIHEETGALVALDNVSFEIQKGEIVAVMGLSGSGKSTLLRCLNRLITPSSGSTLINGYDIGTLNRKDLLALRRTKLGMVFQHFALFPHKTIIENVGYSLEIQNEPLRKRAERALESLQLVGLESRAYSYPHELSGGMQQRVGLARALCMDPDILLMDEAFSSLDPLTRKEMQDELKALQKKLKKTIVFVTHDIDEAVRIADRIILIHEGRVVQEGTAEEIQKNPSSGIVSKFSELFEGVLQ